MVAQLALPEAQEVKHTKKTTLKLYSMWHLSAFKVTSDSTKVSLTPDLHQMCLRTDTAAASVLRPAIPLSVAQSRTAGVRRPARFRKN